MKFRLAWALVLSIAWTLPATAQLDSVTVSYPTVGGSSWPLFLAKEGGYYEKYGMDAGLVFGVHPAGIAMLAGGDAQMTVTTLEESMIAGSRDPSLVLVGTPFRKSLFALMADPSLTSVAELRGRRIGVGQIGDTPYNHTGGILSKFGMTARDVRWFPVGTDANGRATALASGRIDATLLTAPAYYRLEAEGFRELANLHDYDDLYAPDVYLFSRATLDADPGLPERMIRAHAEAIHRFYLDKAFAVETYLKYDPEIDRSDVERMYDSYVDGETFERIPYLPSVAVDYVLDNAADETLATEMRAFDFTRVIDQSAIDRLVEAGFFVDLFGESVIAEQDADAPLAFR